MLINYNCRQVDENRSQQQYKCSAIKLCIQTKRKSTVSSRVECKWLSFSANWLQAHWQQQKIIYRLYDGNRTMFECLFMFRASHCFTIQIAYWNIELLNTRRYFNKLRFTFELFFSRATIYFMCPVLSWALVDITKLT